MPEAPAPPHRVDGSMSLLVDMTAAALDPSYGEAAARRSGDGPAGRPTRSRRVPPVLTALLVVVGLVTGVAAAQVREGAHQAGSVRQSLVDDVRQQTRETDQLADQADRLRAQVAQVRNQALNADERGRTAAALVSELELVTGAVAVRGPGLVVTLDDAPDAATGDGGGRGGQLADGRVYDRDLQDVVNALWAAGAEAVSINGQRLTATTAIRSAGEAVLVDFRPLSPPYVLRAVGDVDAMEPAFADGPTARRFTTWTSLYGLGFTVARAGDLRLPAAPSPDLRIARPGGSS
jgi:uncharacterized protein YlxW (UPF0749 family)